MPMERDPRLHFVVATAIIVKDGPSTNAQGKPKFLIAKRAPHEKAFPNYWSVPGGKLVMHEYNHLPRGFRNRHHDDYGEGGVGRKVQGSSRVGKPRSGVRNREVSKEERSDDPQWYNVVDWVLRKEVKEEVGLEIERPQYLCDLVFVRPDGYPVVTLSYWANYKGGEVKLSKDLTEYAWVTADEAKQYELIDGISDELAEVEKRLRA
ncbi:MAG: hypothetical protein HY435_01800 [Candidatus Liptonbacteria bacterium]|nr:hypothetical protein [Candidatus Liptonbacteria bacterium]